LKHGNGKHLEYSIGSPVFFECKMGSPLNAANIFNVHAFLHGICKSGHRFEVIKS